MKKFINTLLAVSFITIGLGLASAGSAQAYYPPESGEGGGHVDYYPLTHI